MLFQLIFALSSASVASAVPQDPDAVPFSKFVGDLTPFAGAAGLGPGPTNTADEFFGPKKTGSSGLNRAPGMGGEALPAGIGPPVAASGTIKSKPNFVSSFEGVVRSINTVQFRSAQRCPPASYLSFHVS